MGRSLHLVYSSSQDRLKLKVKIVLSNTQEAPPAPLAATTLRTQLNEIRHLAATHNAMDRGHKHHNGTSFVHLWFRPTTTINLESSLPNDRPQSMRPDAPEFMPSVLHPANTEASTAPRLGTGADDFTPKAEEEPKGLPLAPPPTGADTLNEPDEDEPGPLLPVTPNLTVAASEPVESPRALEPARAPEPVCASLPAPVDPVDNPLARELGASSVLAFLRGETDQAPREDDVVVPVPPVPRERSPTMTQRPQAEASRSMGGGSSGDLVSAEATPEVLSQSRIFAPKRRKKANQTTR